MKKTLLLLIIAIVFDTSIIAQNPVLEDSVQINKYDFTQFASESWSFIKQPVEWRGSDWLKLGLISTGTFLIIEIADQPIRNAVLKDQINSKSLPLEFGRMWGELYSTILLFSSFAFHSLLTDDNGTRKIAYEIAQASLYTGAVTYLLKVAIGRARPYMNEGPNSFRPFSSLLSQDYHSLPSGHSVAAFALSTVLSRNAKPVWLKIITYVPAALTVVSRVFQEKHWSSDDFLGAGLGYLIATWIVDQHENNRSIFEISSAFPFSIRIAL